MNEKFYVQVIEFDTGEAIRRLGPYNSKRLAENAERGIERNLDHSRFFTRIAPAPDSAKPRGR